MPNDQTPLIAPTHLNHGLFSDYYLNQIAPTLDDWNADSLYPEAMRLREELRAELHKIEPAKLDEAQLEERWVKFVLEKLGHFWSVQVKIRFRDKGFRKPDYVFAQDEAAARALGNDIYTPDQLRDALALGDAKRWGVNFDRSTDRENPSQQIDEYLRYSEVRWGILTDGRYWRLYERSTSRDNTYYAVDLPALLNATSENPAQDIFNFYYFLLFFRRAAFLPGGWLERVLEGSETYAENLSDTLEDEVYEALQLIAQGFFDYRRNRLQPTPDTLKQVYDHSLILLYRLLFILYAESRAILPIDTNEMYAQVQSLRAVAAKADRDAAGTILSDRAVIYEGMSSLFFALDQGNDEVDIPPYNGRLFSESEYPFLAKNKVGDRTLRPALEKITRVDERKPTGRAKPRRVNVDYRDLDVRHLGAIYEKLLEYELDVAAQPLTLKGGKYVTAAAKDKIAVEKGKVYLRTGNNERKVTGSYYTPDYIVRFIIERTLDPLMMEIAEQRGAFDADGNYHTNEPAAVRNAVLNLNLLDPATGSGHFIVEAVNHLAEWLRRLHLEPADLAVDDDELIYWKRQVVTHCIYGIDINPLAVELAKLSLWLTTLSRGQPLSFLDHHLRVGNTLVGARAAEIGIEVGKAAPTDQLPLFSDASFTVAIGDAVGKMTAIEATAVHVVGDVKAQEQTYDTLRQALAPYQRLADVWTARDFGLPLTAQQWQVMMSHLPTSDSPSLRSGDAVAVGGEVLAQAATLAAQHRFLHPELAFPEVFFAPDGTPLPDGGFDAVIGNPPYVRQQSISQYKPYLQVHYKTFDNNADLFLYFFERGLRLLKSGRRLGYITAGTYMSSGSAKPFRGQIIKEASIEAAVNFGENQPFKGAEMVYPTMLVLHKQPARETFQSLFVNTVWKRDELQQVLEFPMEVVAKEVLDQPEWRFQPIPFANLTRKLFGTGRPLEEAVHGNLYYGVLTGLNDAFVIDEKRKRELIVEHASSEELVKPLVRGQDLRPWYQMDSELFLIAARQGINIDEYPAIKGHLEQFRSKLEVKPKTWDDKVDGKWEGRTSGNYQWYEWHDTVAYHTEFEKSKIFWAEIAKLPRFSWDDAKLYMTNKAHCLKPDSKSLLSILNSRVIWFVISQICVPLRLRAGLWQYQLTHQFVERLPIPQLTADQESALAALAEELTALARTRYALHESFRHRISADLGSGGKLNETLESWWQLADFTALRDNAKKAFKRDIPLPERGDWERYLADQQAQHAAHTAQIVAGETRLNAIVYEAFKLSPDEIALIEKATQYPYGAV